MIKESFSDANLQTIVAQGFLHSWTAGTCSTFFCPLQAIRFDPQILDEHQALNPGFFDGEWIEI